MAAIIVFGLLLQGMVQLARASFDDVAEGISILAPEARSYVAHTVEVIGDGLGAAFHWMEKALEPSRRSDRASYIVRSGDTLSRIAAQHGLSLGELVETGDNRQRFPDPDRIKPGQIVELPK